MVCLFSVTRAVLEVDGVVRILIEELPKILCYGNGLKLIGMR